MALYAEDVQFEDVTFAHKITGRAELEKFFAGYFERRTGEHVFSATEYTRGADPGAVEWIWRAKHAGDFLGVPAAGRTTEARGVSVLSFRGGKFVSRRNYWDSGTVLRQVEALK